MEALKYERIDFKVCKDVEFVKTNVLQTQSKW